MNKNDLVQIALARLGQRQGDAVLQAALEAEIPLIQSRLEGGVRVGLDDRGIFFPWFLVTEDDTLVQAIGAETVALPADFIAGVSEVESPTLWYLSNDSDDPWKGLTSEPLDRLRIRWRGTGDAPHGYALVGTALYVRPVPASTAVTLRLLYIGQQPALTDSVLENAWTQYAADVLVEELVIAGTRYTRDSDIRGDAEKSSKDARERLYKLHVARTESLEERSMGEAP